MLGTEFYKSILYSDSIDESLIHLKDYAKDTIGSEHICVMITSKGMKDKNSDLYTINLSQTAIDAIQIIEQQSDYFTILAEANGNYIKEQSSTTTTTTIVPEIVEMELEVGKIGFNSIYAFSLTNRIGSGFILFCFQEAVILPKKQRELCFLVGKHMKQLIEKVQFRKQIVKQTSYENLFNTLRIKDNHTVNHSYNVSFYSCLLGAKIGLSEEQLEILKMSALLHDIGKISIPDQILLKPGRLTDEEFRVIKRHPLIGYELLKDLPDMETVLPVVRWHHERMDGKGYPDQLRQQEIPLLVRIVGIADAFDAMTSNRVYQKCLSISEVKQQLWLHSGTQFDQKLTILFLEILEEQTKINQFSDHNISSRGDK